MADWGFLSGLFDTLQVDSPMLGRFWLLLMLVFRMLILGTVATDLFEDEQAEFACNTLQPGCKQVCYDQAFPISQYRFWVLHIVLISTPSLVFLMYAMHHKNKKAEGRCWGPASCVRDDRHMRRLYIINVGFRMMAEVAFVVGQWWLYGFWVEAQFPCSRFPCPHTVDCFTSRPMEKTVFLCFYFVVGVLSALASLAELLHVTYKWFSSRARGWDHHYSNQNKHNLAQKEASALQGPRDTSPRYSRSSSRQKCGSLRSTGSIKFSSIGRKTSKSKSLKSSIAV
ncbi:hypothetical protein SKAU_G00134990 [Synaphobranchus kaupii]|uniref:Gap junction protein n=1 Tax=Synaphobranchus kaupii TaxID=118154 RepID=A0A9Q1J3Q1_SYNKA|nr:hypothetical protein SKAU_G00134990 [Synaphobranchus kaupii]